MEQMSLMALADTIATTSTDIGESRDRSQGKTKLGRRLEEKLMMIFLLIFFTENNLK